MPVPEVVRLLTDSAVDRTGPASPNIRTPPPVPVPSVTAEAALMLPPVPIWSVPPWILTVAPMAELFPVKSTVPAVTVVLPI